MRAAQSEVQPRGIRKYTVFGPQSVASTEYPYPVVRVCFRSANSSPLLSDTLEHSQLRFQPAWLSVTSDIRWVPVKSSTKSPTTLIDFRRASCLLLSRLSERFTWEDVNQHVHIQENKDGNYLIVRGSLRSRSSFRQVELVIAAAEGQQLDFAELQGILYMRIAPRVLLFSAMQVSKQVPVHLRRVTVIQNDLIVLSDSAELDVLVNDATQTPNSTHAKTSRTTFSDDPCTAVKTLMDYLARGAIITEYLRTCIGSSTPPQTADVFNAFRTVTILSATFQMMSSCVQTAVLLRESRRGGNLSSAIFCLVVQLYRKLSKCVKLVFHVAAETDGMQQEETFELLEQATKMMGKAERELMKRKLVRKLKGYYTKEVQDYWSVLQMDTLRYIQKNEIEPETVIQRSNAIPGTHEMRPYQCDFFSGRTTELQDLYEKLSTHGKALISQHGGSGKTQFMVHFANDAEENNVVPGGVFWATVDGNEAHVLDSIANFTNAMSGEDMEIEERVDRKKVVLKLKNEMDKLKGRWLLCLDNADDPNANSILEDICSLASVENGWVVLTSKQDAISLYPVLENAQTVQVQPLSIETSMVVLWRWKVGKTRKEATDEEIFDILRSDKKEYSALERIISNLDLNGLPLALANIGGYIVRERCAFHEYAKITDNRRSEASLEPILEADVMGCRIRKEQCGIWCTWKKNEEGLDASVRQVLNSIALFDCRKIPAGVMEGVLEWVANHDGNLRSEIKEKVQRELVHETSLAQIQSTISGETVSIHPLIRRFVLAKLLRQDEEFKLALRIATTVLHQAIRICSERWGMSMHEPLEDLDESIKLLVEHALSVVQRSWATSSHGQEKAQRKTVMRFSTSLREGRKAEARSQEGDRKLEDLHFFVMHALRHQQRWAEALEVGQKLLERYDNRKESRANNGNKSDVLQTIGMLLSDEGILAEEGKLLESIVHIDRSLLGNGKDDINRAVALSNLGLVKEKQGCLREAAEICRESLAMLRRLFGESADHEQIAKTMSRLAIIQAHRCFLAEPQEILEKCTQMVRRIVADGKVSHDISIAMNNMAVLKRDYGKLEEAEILFRESLAMKRRVYGEAAFNTRIARTLRDLGSVLKLQGSFDEADKTLRECITMFELVHGEDADHQDLREARNALQQLRG